MLENWHLSQGVVRYQQQLTNYRFFPFFHHPHEIFAFGETSSSSISMTFFFSANNHFSTMLHFGFVLINCFIVSQVHWWAHNCGYFNEFKLIYAEKPVNGEWKPFIAIKQGRSRIRLINLEEKNIESVCLSRLVRFDINGRNRKHETR